MRRAIASAIENQAHLVAFYDAFKKSMNNIDTGLVLVQFPDFCPSEALPFLAQQYDVLGFKGFALCTTDTQRRQLIKDAIELHRTKGTPYSIKRAIVGVGYDSVIVREHTGSNLDGTWLLDGSRTLSGGQWYNFSVEVFYTGSVPTAERIILVNKLIEEYKNVRSVLLELKFTHT